MDDKTFLQQKKRVEKLFDKWRNPLGLGWWRVTLVYSREKNREEANDHDADINSTWETIFNVRSDFYYKTALITAFLPVIENIKDTELERYFLHECMHIHLTPMKHKDRAPQEELVATTLADVVLWVVDEFGKKKKK